MLTVDVTGVERAFDDLAALAAALCEVPIGAVVMVDERRVRFEGLFGAELSDTDRAGSVWASLPDEGEVVVVTNARTDERFRAHAFVSGDQAIRFYAGAAIVTGAGEVVGTVGILDRAPRQLTERQRDALLRLGRLAGRLLEGRPAQPAPAAPVAAPPPVVAPSVVVVAEDDLPNRRQLLDRLRQAFARLRRKGGMVAVLFVRLAGPRDDAEAHADAGQRLRACVRGHDVVGRVGEADFVVLCDEMRGVEETVALAHRLIASLPMGGSIGIACTVAALGGSDELLRRAENAMHQATRLGRNQVEVAGP